MSSSSTTSNQNIRFSKFIIRLYINFAGGSLHMRGYRLKPGLAAIKENLAAAILIRSGWAAMG
jgi:23S rRNA (guanine2445-N2)-methyltransferase / 23S rRNA (guanine2069-N7)-methyltransferase